MLLKKFVVGFSLVAAATSAQAVTIDGNLSFLEYAGAIVTTVSQDRSADPSVQYPNSPGTYVENVGYTVYYTSDATNIYVALLSSGSTSGLNFANLYFDTNPSTGSDIGFEVTNNRAFVPGVPGFSALSITDVGGAFATGMIGPDSVIEFMLPWTVFTTDAFGLNQPLVAPGGALQLRTSQSFNYSAVTGDGLQGDTTLRFGSVLAPAADVPEPATWAMFISGFGLIGAAMRRNRRTAIRFAR